MEIRKLLACLLGLGMMLSLASAEPPVIMSVSISPEARVKVDPGTEPLDLIQNEWRDYEIEILNSAGITSALQLESPHFIDHGAAEDDAKRDGWLEWKLEPEGRLSGERLEKRMLKLRTNHIGIRSALIHVNAGQGTQDLGFRSDVLLNFQIKNNPIGHNQASELETIHSSLHLALRDVHGVPLAARVYLKNARGESINSAHDGYFLLDGETDLSIPCERYIYQIDKGPEWIAQQGELLVEPKGTELTITLERLTDLAKEGWWAGDLGMDFDLSEIPVQMRASDLWIGEAITWSNQMNHWKNEKPPAPRIQKTPDLRWFHLVAGCDQRSGGVVSYHGLREPLGITDFPDLTAQWPISQFVVDLAARREAWIHAHISSPSDLPVWLASGKLDSLGVGDDLTTHASYFHALNTGLRIPLAGIVSSRPGQHGRVYVHVGQSLTWQGWWDALKAGRTMVTTGPLQIHLAGKLDSADPLTRIELIRNGRVETIALPHLMTMQESGWFALRFLTDHKVALIAPWYVEIGGTALKPQRADVQVFRELAQQRQEQVTRAITEPEKRRSAIASFEAAENTWIKKMDEAVPLITVRGHVIDAASGRPLPSRITLRNLAGSWFFPQSDGGSAVRYEKRNFRNPLSEENHTTLTAHPWIAHLPAGRYTLVIEHGKEWRPLLREIVVSDQPLEMNFPMERWIDMQEDGWYSGETHVHRTLLDLPNLMLAEDLNVAFPLTYWTIRDDQSPRKFDPSATPEQPAELIKVDETHVIWPCNTEWEIFSLGGHEHTTGAIFALGHRMPLPQKVPPLLPMLAAARKQGAFFDMDKPDWPWMALLPELAPETLYELSNNHVWQVPFAITPWFTPAPAWMLPHATHGGNERDWIEYTHQTYWALLNCGKRLRPTAGTASGVHPVPLGFSRVYVHCPQGFSYAHWLDGLHRGNSFVTTGPMCMADFSLTENGVHLTAQVAGEQAIGSVELIVNGSVKEIIPVNQDRASIERTLTLDGTSWFALRVWEPREDGRARFAHTAPVWFDVKDKPLRARTEQAAFILQRMQDEINRSKPWMNVESLRESQAALESLRKQLEISP
ncbi:MAG: hypothetical protein EAZ42_02305 [Verrucomicrobia bacterium]|nr:MAG: hypothetical protein EAZ42_02305 [Verrucomicrobiota bacterium]